jgi:EAL domain-containing protein (putative c-di-GMP-specific phosphodiesterase class I)
MSLFKQLTILITVFLVFMLTVLLWFILSYNKNLIENQLSSNAKNSASFLGLSISKNVDFKDTATMEGMISSIVDNGFYEYIAIYDTDEKVRVKLSNPREIGETPEWFSNIFEINAPSSTANIMKGWLNQGVLEVKIHQDYANNQMWKTFNSISNIFTLLTIILLVVFYFFIDKLLKPLKRLSIQAKAIDNNEFIIEKSLPNTIEFKNVVQAMNKTISKMETIFNKEVETLNKYNDLLYKDNDTNLGNKNYLILKLNSYLKNSHGLLTFIEIKDEISFKKKVGFKNYTILKNYIINEIKSKFESDRNMIFSVLTDGSFAVLLPHILYEDVDKRWNEIYINIQKHIKDSKLNELFDVKVAFGISNYVQNTSLKDILSKADQSLSLAMQDSVLKLNYLEKDVQFTKQEWIELLQWAFKNDGLYFDSQNVLDTSSNKIFMKEYYTRLKNEDGTIYFPGDFLSIVNSMGWMSQLEKQIIEKIFKNKIGSKNKDNAVINLTSDFISNKTSVNWLINELNTDFLSSNTTFYFECPNGDILAHLDDFIYFTKEIANTNHKFAIESFTFDNDNLDYLKTLKPEYLKISKSYLVDDNRITDSILLNITSTIGAYLIVKHVETQEEFDFLKDIGIKYLQGRFIDELMISDV